MTERGKIRTYKISPKSDQSIYEIEIAVDHKSLAITYKEKERFFVKTFTIGDGELHIAGWVYDPYTHLIVAKVVLLEKQFSRISIGMDELPGGLSILSEDKEIQMNIRLYQSSGIITRSG